MNRDTKKYFNYLVKRAEIKRTFKDITDELWFDKVTGKLTALEHAEWFDKAFKEQEEALALAEKIYKVTR